MDPQIEELKELVRQNIILAQDTNKQLHKMRRGALIGRIFYAIFWVALIVLPTIAFYTYASPYIGGFMSAYSNAQNILSNFQHTQQTQGTQPTQTTQ